MFDWLRLPFRPSDRRARQLERYAIPDPLWAQTVARFDALTALGADDLARLREMATLFIAEKSFSSAHGLTLSDEMIVAIAAQAALPVLNLGLEWYRGWVGIVVYPGEFLIRKTVTDDAGVVHGVTQEASGEAWEGGPVILSWSDVAMDEGELPYNVVIHEFAHKLDMLDGEADGVPPFSARLHPDLDRERWLAVFDPVYDAFCARCDRVPRRRWDDFCDSSLIDPYAAESPAEFFAVCAETFFTAPDRFAAWDPALYQLYAAFFRQDPAGTGRQAV